MGDGGAGAKGFIARSGAEAVGVVHVKAMTNGKPGYGGGDEVVGKGCSSQHGGGGGVIGGWVAGDVGGVGG